MVCERHTGQALAPESVPRPFTRLLVRARAGTAFHATRSNCGICELCAICDPQALSIMKAGLAGPKSKGNTDHTDLTDFTNDTKNHSGSCRHSLSCREERSVQSAKSVYPFAVQAMAQKSQPQPSAKVRQCLRESAPTLLTDDARKVPRKFRARRRASSRAWASVRHQSGE
jgi:hypothetical protein